MPIDYRPTSQANEAETYGRQDTGNGSGQGWDERAFSAQVAEWPIAVASETGGSRRTPPIETIPAPPGLARDPLSEIWGDLSDADSAGLLADVRAHGVRQPILVDLDKGTVVDGWHRYRMAAQAGRECPAIDVASWPAAEVEAAVQSSNRHRRHSSRKELLGAMARQRLTGESAPSQTVEQEARFAGVTKRRYQQVLQATREDLGLAPPNSGGRSPAAAVQEDAEALDLERMLELQAETIEAQQRAAAGLAAQVMAAAVQQLAECRQLWPGGVDTAARLKAAIKVLGGCRRASVLWPGLSRAALLVFRLGEIEDDALVSLLDCHTKTPAGPRRFCANFSTRWHYNAGRPTPRFQSLIYIIYI